MSATSRTDIRKLRIRAKQSHEQELETVNRVTAKLKEVLEQEYQNKLKSLTELEQLLPEETEEEKLRRRKRKERPESGNNQNSEPRPGRPESVRQEESSEPPELENPEAQAVLVTVKALAGPVKTSQVCNALTQTAAHLFPDGKVPEKGRIKLLLDQLHRKDLLERYTHQSDSKSSPMTFYRYPSGSATTIEGAVAVMARRRHTQAPQRGERPPKPRTPPDAPPRPSRRTQRR